MSTNKISIIIVNYNSTKKLIGLIRSINTIKTIIDEIIIVDNNSKKFNFRIKPTLKYTLIRNSENLGFSKAVNQGIDISSSKYILLLNPDSSIPIDSNIIQMFDYIKNHKDIYIIGGKIISKNQKFTANSKPSFLTGIFEFTNLKKLFPNNVFSKRFWPENENILKITDVDSLCGAFMLFKKRLNKIVLHFDENYFLYLEDLDFCLKVKKQGGKVVFYPKAKILHIGGYSSKSRYNIVIKHWYTSRKYFFSKHLNKFESIIINIIFTIEERLLSIYHYITHTPNE